MLKFIQVKLLSIAYTGDSVGNDIRAEIEMRGKFVRVEKRAKPGTTINLDQNIGIFETDQKSFKADVAITIVEKDFLFNDMGSVEETVSVDTSSSDPQLFTFTVKVRESRSPFGKFWGRRVATFVIAFGATVVDAVRYMPDDDAGSGWTKVRFEGDNSSESLPAFLKVQYVRSDDKREYFTVLEGPYRGRSASVIMQKGASLLISDTSHMPMARATYSISQKLLILWHAFFGLYDRCRERSLDGDLRCTY